MHFKRSVQRYGRTPIAETPYQRAGQVWDDRIGSARVQASNWRLMAIGGLALSTAMAAALVWQSLQSRVVPYVVEVDKFGAAQSVAPVSPDFQPTDHQTAWFLSRFVTNVRSRPLDPVLLRANWLQAYDFASGRGALFLNEYARRNPPFERIGERTVSVQVSSVVRASDNSFQVQWTETAYERGSLAGTSRWTAVLTVALDTPDDADTLRRNPLGLYVEAIDWARQLEAQESGEPRARTTRAPLVAPERPWPSPEPPPGADNATHPPITE